ncbi:MAG TPA: response regulator [Caulobacteraceae bacterium]|jgi:CheY-like chemotaxis protein
MAVILIVDDDPTVRMIATELLRSSNHAVIEAEDGDEALRILKSVPVDLVVLDMLMPNKDGLETLMELRKTGPQVRILAISSGGRMDGDGLLRIASAMGADDVMSKPLRADKFDAKINELLAQPIITAGPFAAAR